MLLQIMSHSYNQMLSQKKKRILILINKTLSLFPKWKPISLILKQYTMTMLDKSTISSLKRKMKAINGMLKKSARLMKSFKMARIFKLFKNETFKNSL